MTTTLFSIPVVTGIPFYDGLIDGFLFIPMKLAGFIGSTLGINVYTIGFWMGVCFAIVVVLRLVFGWD